ncbi:hypothetical protein [Phytoactinopolyspora halophila]|nr:hypothetical protein [Phytoactinopolyspora halophila]
MDDDEIGEELDEAQDSLYHPCQWSWTLWAGQQFDSIGNIFDNIGTMFHDTTIMLRQHYRWKKEREHLMSDGLREIRQLTGE